MPELMPLLDKQGNKLEPVTLGECVTMGNGDNIDVLMSKTQMFTPTITQDKSMFKVGTGVDVDYSANVKDGAYESLVFKGKSLVNLMTSCKDETLIQYHNPPADSNVVNVSMIKTNTVYTIIYSVKYQEEGNTGHLIVRTQRDGGDINVSSGFTFGTTYKRFAYKFTTPSTIDYFVLRSNGHYFYVKEVMLLEGDYTNVDLPYFEGLCDSKMPILRNVGKNLLDPQTFIPLDKGVDYVRYEDGYVLANFTNANTHFFYEVDLARLPKGMYTVVAKHEGESYHLGIQYTLKDGTKTWGGTQFNNDGSYAELGLYFQSTTTDPSLKVKAKIMLVANSDTTTTYEDYKTNILRTSEEIVLREINGVQDTYNALTGEYVKRIEECVLDGSQTLSLDGSLVYLGLTDRPINNSGIADKVPVITVNQLLTGEFGICMQDRGTSGRIYINIEGLTTREEILQYLRTNPITVQYELAEPITTIVKPYTTPFAYQDGHVILESGYEGK